MSYFNAITEALIRNIGGSAGRKIRYWYYRKKLGSCGKKVYIDVNVTLLNPRKIFIGDKVWIDNGVILMAGQQSNDRKTAVKTNEHYQYKRGELHIGDEVHIGPQVIIQSHGGCEIGSKLTIGAGSKIYTLSHHYQNILDKTDSERYYFGSMVPSDQQFLIECAVVVKAGSAIGLNCVLLPGAVVPRFTWLGAGIIVKGLKLEEFSTYQIEQQLIKKKLESNSNRNKDE